MTTDGDFQFQKEVVFHGVGSLGGLGNDCLDQIVDRLYGLHFTSILQTLGISTTLRFEIEWVGLYRLICLIVHCWKFEYGGLGS